MTTGFPLHTDQPQSSVIFDNAVWSMPQFRTSYDDPVADLEQRVAELQKNLQDYVSRGRGLSHQFDTVHGALIRLRPACNLPQRQPQALRTSGLDRPQASTFPSSKPPPPTQSSLTFENVGSITAMPPPRVSQEEPAERSALYLQPNLNWLTQAAITSEERAASVYLIPNVFHRQAHPDTQWKSPTMVWPSPLRIHGLLAHNIVPHRLGAVGLKIAGPYPNDVHGNWPKQSTYT
ncbi:hypothetical protein EV421DRAFT_1740692 [Armillaria borealis]|uniref:Uncharacterized protein n=1 Tax=Armillaria borealis TaxID=47425 RepID=A0AA39MI87_9AGAR|nr:hypothetical protein EV421DRAFT_1740692 [Armillaria borealis]